MKDLWNKFEERQEWKLKNIIPQKKYPYIDEKEHLGLLTNHQEKNISFQREALSITLSTSQKINIYGKISPFYYDSFNKRAIIIKYEGTRRKYNTYLEALLLFSCFSQIEQVQEINITSTDIKTVLYSREPSNENHLLINNPLYSLEEIISLYITNLYQPIPIFPSIKFSKKDDKDLLLRVFNSLKENDKEKFEQYLKDYNKKVWNKIIEISFLSKKSLLERNPYYFFLYNQSPPAFDKFTQEISTWIKFSFPRLLIDL